MPRIYMYDIRYMGQTTGLTHINTQKTLRNVHVYWITALEFRKISR